MKVMTIFGGLSLGALLVGCCTAPEPGVSPQEAQAPDVRMGKRVHLPCVIEFSLCFLKASLQDLSAAGFDVPDRGVDAATILAKLKQNTNVEIVACQRACANSGENCVLKNVTEYIYPQDFKVNDITVYSAPSNAEQRASSCRIPTVEPQNFTMREAGLIFDATAKANDDGLIELDCKMQFVGDPTWKDFGMRLPFAPDGRTAASPSDIAYYDLEMKQPIFPFSSAETRLHVKSGTTLALVAGSNTDTKEDRMAVFFLTVRKLDIVEPK